MAPPLALFVLALSLALAQAQAQAQVPGEKFSRHRLPLLTELAEVYAFDLDGDGDKELIVVEVDRGRPKAIPHLRVFSRVFNPESSNALGRRDAEYKLLSDRPLALPANLAMAAAGRFSAGPALVLLMPHRLELWPWAGGRFHPGRAISIAQESIFVEPGGALKTGLRWIADLSGDGYDEIIVPRLDGFQVLRVGADWELSLHARLATRTRSRLWFRLRQKFVAYHLPILRILELNGGGWKDIVAYSDGLVQIFYLSDQPSMAPRPPDRKFDLQPPRPFDPTQPRDPPLKLVAAEDLNGDGLLDIVGSKVAATGSAMNTNTRVLVYYGRPAEGEGGFTLPSKPDQVFASEGFTHPILVDINGDGSTDLALVNVEIGLWTMIRALIARTVSAETAFYLMPLKGRYPTAPNEVVGFSVSFSLGRFSHQPLAAFGDFNADGRPDLLLSADKAGLGIHWGLAGGVWDDDYDYLIEDFLPMRSQRVRVGDIDGDGRDDLIFVYDRNDIRQMPEVNKTFTVLLSRFATPRPKIAGSPQNSDESSP